MGCALGCLENPCLLTGFRLGIESGWEEVLRDEQDDGEFGGTQ